MRPSTTLLSCLEMVSANPSRYVAFAIFRNISLRGHEPRVLAMPMLLVLCIPSTSSIHLAVLTRSLTAKNRIGRLLRGCVNNTEQFYLFGRERLSSGVAADLPQSDCWCLGTKISLFVCVFFLFFCSH